MGGSNSQYNYSHAKKNVEKGKAEKSWGIGASDNVAWHPK